MTKLVKKLKLNEETIRNICAQEHLIKNVYPKSRMKKIQVEFKGDVITRLNAIKKGLNVSLDAIVAGILVSQKDLK